jgi:hypothetical protein
VTRLSPGKFYSVAGNTPQQETARLKLHMEKPRCTSIWVSFRSGTPMCSSRLKAIS